MLVDHGIDFDDFKTQHATVIGNDLHGKVSLAVGRAAAHGSTHAGRVFGIDPVHVERNVVAGGAATRHAQGFFHHGTHATLVNVAHGEDADSGAPNIFFLHCVDVAHAHQHAVLRLHLGGEVEDVAQFRGPQSHQCCQRHPVDVAAGR